MGCYGHICERTGIRTGVLVSWMNGIRGRADRMWKKGSGVLVMLAVFLLLAGCTSDASPGVATLTSPGVAGASSEYRLFQCLVGAGVPVEWSDEQGSSGLRVSGGDFVWTFPNTDGGLAELRIDGVDYSQAFAACLGSSGYDPTTVSNDTSREMQEKQTQVSVNNTWAACARSHGYPNLADSTPAVADGEKTTPIVLLPATITKWQLGSLLLVCPNYTEQSSSQDMGNWAPDPRIGFDWPGFDGGGAMPDKGDATSMRLFDLETVLFESAMNYHDRIQSESPR